LLFASQILFAPQPSLACIKYSLFGLGKFIYLVSRLY
jgi:hypothetical protein